MARTGKIARLPLALRDELCERLRDGEPGSTILPWVNAQGGARKVLDKHFDRSDINDQNLSEWRAGGYQDWLADQQHTERARRISEMSARIAQAAGGHISQGLLAQAAGVIHEAIEGLAGAQAPVEGEGEGPDLSKLVKALTAIRGMELETVKTQMKRQELAQKGEALKLEQRKFQRTTCELFLKWFDDQTAKEIAAKDGPADGKLEALGRHLFGEAW